jgi:DHA2 family multidrug resistance protein-like MFS transporter
LAALGIAVLGSVAMAFSRVALPADPPQAARDTLGGAVASGGPELAAAARASFVTGLTVTSAIAAVLALPLAVVAAVVLRPARADTAPATATDAVGIATTAAADAADMAVDELCPC